MLTTQFKNGFDARFPRTFNHLFDHLLTDSAGGRTAISPFVLKADAIETADSFEIMAAVPGLAKENINLELHEGKLTISGERKLAQPSDKKFHLLETSYGRFSRTFLVPENVNADGIKASFENGMLYVLLPKDEQKILRRKIEINSEQPTVAVSENTVEDTAEKQTKNTKTQGQKSAE